METKLNDNMCNFKIGACYKNTKYDPNSDTLRSVKYFIYLGENTFSPIYDWGYEISVKLEYDSWKNFVEVTKDEAFRNVNDVDMNDNEVKEVARMQRLITKYENVISALFIKAKTGNEIKLLQFEEQDMKEEIRYLWKWIKEHKDNK